MRLATTGNHWKCRFTFFCEVLSKEVSKKIVNIGWGVAQHVEKSNQKVIAEIGKQHGQENSEQIARKK